jgi:cobalt-zinc-cadmium efflux system outer membrane protein
MKLRKVLQILSLLPGLAFAGPDNSAAFVEPAGALTLQRALALALTRNPRLAGFSYELRAAEARILQAKLFPNPEADFATEDFGGSGQSSGFNVAETTLALGQLIELGGKRRARVQEARFDRDLTGFDYETRKREVFLETHQLFVDVLAGQRRVAVSEELVSLSNSFLPAMKKRVEAGKASAIEETRFQVAVATATIELEAARRGLIAAHYRLAAQWGATTPRFSTAAGDLDRAPSVGSLDSLVGQVDRNPRVARFDAERGRRSALLARERAAAIPDLRLRGGVRRQAEFDSTGFVAGFSLPLPLFNRNQGAIRAASETLAKTDADEAAAFATVRNELTNAYQALLTARTSLELLRDTVLPGARDAMSGINDGFQLGRYSYLEVLDAQRTLNSAQAQYLGALADYHKALAVIEAITADAPVPHAISHSVR